MMKKICDSCKKQNDGCSLKKDFREYVTNCSMYKVKEEEENDQRTDNIDWEQRKFDLAKQLYVMLMSKEFRVPKGVTAKDIQDQFSAQAINAATVFVEKYREG